MINSEVTISCATNGGSGSPALDKQQPVGAKKTALRDVQNENGNTTTRNHPDTSMCRRPTTEAIKVCGTKRLTPERPLVSPCHLSLSNHEANEHIMNARRRFELELGRGRFQSNMGRYPEVPQPRPSCELHQEIHPQKASQIRESNTQPVTVSGPNHVISTVTSTYNGTSVPNSVGKHGNSKQLAKYDSYQVANVRHPINSMGADEQQRTERFIRLQKFLKQCDESDHSVHIQMLLRLSPAELSRHAVELEKRAIQLTIEEGKEMQRMKALNILGKSVPTNSPLPAAQLLDSRK